ncbi:Amino-acid acetyltransferase [Methanosarcinaceae archaeon Ag5]|uniref:Amino-acid acetyltransferase n=1 Tax=Methanolapillus africanus TaxID=3028297 RepID=A0AAE4MI82_9EURY|nr:Amino-acid acetyltransferase [Methanosarcinaceae archaeon Ag5]
MIRKAKMSDVYEIKALINSYATEGCMLPRSLDSLYTTIRDFMVFEENGHIIGCCGIHPDWEDLGEVVSFAVVRGRTRQGIGTELLDACIEDAKTVGMNRLFVLTSSPLFFERKGFTQIKKDELPWKIWADCVNCSKYPDCDSASLIMEI